MLKQGKWPKDQQIFSPYSPTSTGYTQVQLHCPILPGVPQFKKPRPLTFSWHVLLAVYNKRFMAKPAFSKKEMEDAFREGHQASHLMGNIPMAAMGINPHMMTVEQGMINRSRHLCSLHHAWEEYKATKPRLRRAKGEHELVERFKKDMHTWCPCNTTQPFTCLDHNLHDPPCQGWDHTQNKIPELVQYKWDNHMAAVEQKMLKKQREQWQSVNKTHLQLLLADKKAKQEELAKLERKIKTEREKNRRRH